MIKKFLILFLCALFLSCSGDNNSINQDSEVLPSGINLRYVSELRGDEHTKMLYEDGLLYKGLGNSNEGDSHYSGAFQVEYNENQRVKRVLASYISRDKSNGFNFDLNDAYEEQYLEVYNYNYSNDRLMTITSESGHPDQEFVYDERGRVIKFLFHHDDRTREYSFTYNNADKMIAYEDFESNTGDLEYGEIVSDDKVNPYYVFWLKHSFMMPWDFSNFADDSWSFYPHNILEIYEGTELHFKADIQYENDYPHIFDQYELGGLDNHEPTIFKYLD